MKKLLTIPSFESYEDLLSSSWLTIRIATVTVILIAFQSKRVIEEFSLYEGLVQTIHSFGITFTLAIAVLIFTVKISKLEKKDRLRTTLTYLIFFFAFLEFLLSVFYHIIWYNVETSTTKFIFPPLNDVRMWITVIIDTALPISLFFYGHTVHIKSESEKRLYESRTQSKKDEDSINIGDSIYIETLHGKGATLKILKKTLEDNEKNEPSVPVTPTT